MEQLIVIDVDADGEVEPLVPFVDYFEIVELDRGGGYFDEVGLFGVPAHDHPVDLRLQSQLLVLVVVDEPLRKAGPSPSVLKQNKTDLASLTGTIGDLPESI